MHSSPRGLLQAIVGCVSLCHRYGFGESDEEPHHLQVRAVIAVEPEPPPASDGSDMDSGIPAGGQWGLAGA